MPSLLALPAMHVSFALSPVKRRHWLVHALSDAFSPHEDVPMGGRGMSLMNSKGWLALP